MSIKVVVKKGMVSIVSDNRGSVDIAFDDLEEVVNVLSQLSSKIFPVDIPELIEGVKSDLTTLFVQRHGSVPELVWPDASYRGKIAVGLLANVFVSITEGEG